MSLLREAERQRASAELLQHKEAIERIANDVVNDIIIRKNKLIALRALMETSDVFDTNDINDLNSVVTMLREKTQNVYDLVMQNT